MFQRFMIQSASVNLCHAAETTATIGGCPVKSVGYPADLAVPWVDVRGLGSHVLSRVVRQLRADWQRKYARPLHLVETFVAPSRFAGSCYRAAQWIDLGQTTGRTRQDRWSQIQVPPKRVFVYPLTCDFRSALRS